MSNTIQPSYGAQTYSAPTKARETKQTGTQGSSFMDMAAQASRSRADTFTTGLGGLAGMAAMPTSLMMDLAVRSGGQVQAGSVEATEATAAPSLETMLKAKYPNIHYHVFDASSSFWKTRNDYPHYMLYQKNADVSALENWKPKGPNPEYMASKEIRALSQVPPGSRAVVIHPKVQARMEQEPEYAKEIAARIDAWFTFDLLRNEAIIPGCSMELSQSVAIGEDGNIVNVQTSSPGRITYSKSGSEEEIDYWEIRLNRHAYFLKQWQEEQIEHKMEVSRQFKEQNMTEAVKAQLARLINGNDFKNIIGDTIAGVSTDAVLAQTRALIWG